MSVCTGVDIRVRDGVESVICKQGIHVYMYNTRVCLCVWEGGCKISIDSM